MDNIAGGATTEQETDANRAQGYVARPMPLETTPGLRRATIQRRQPGPQDVQIDILFCAVCHSGRASSRGSDRNRAVRSAGESVDRKVNHGNLANSARAPLTIAISGSASFHSVRRSL